MIDTLQGKMSSVDEYYVIWKNYPKKFRNNIKASNLHLTCFEWWSTLRAVTELYVLIEHKTEKLV